MGNVLAISSQVVWGPVGNTAAVPALQSHGHHVMQVPTILLSNHPGHGTPQGRATEPHLFENLLQRAFDLGAFQNLDAVLTGYFASPDQVSITARFIRLTKPRQIAIDPVIGDHGKLYVADEVAQAIRGDLLPLATITTPNIFELGWFTGHDVSTHDQVITAARSLNCAEVIATSVPLAPDQLETILVRPETITSTATPKRPHVPNGTGDFLAGHYLGARLLMSAEEALTTASSALAGAIERSAGGKVLIV
jgi:pyridoxine kinase